MATSAEIVATLERATSEDELLSELAWTLMRAAGSESCDILFREGDGLVLRASTVVPELAKRLRLGPGKGLCGYSIQNSKAVFVPQNAQAHPKFARYPGLDDFECESLAIVPLSAEAEPFGVLLFRSGRPWNLTPKVKAHLRDLADLAVHCIRGFLAAYQAGTQSNRLGALSEVSKTIATSPYIEEILQLLVNLTAQQFDYRVCTVRLLDENRGELVLRATQAPAKAYQRKRAIKLGESIAGRAISENRPIYVRDVQVEADYIGHDLAVEQGLRSMICVPLTLQDRPVGVLSCYTSEVRDFTPDEIKALETLAKQAAVSIEHAKLQVRSTLMQEMHHRVKNNLQQVASLLRLQMRHSQDLTLEEALEDCLHRVLAIASVHDLLSREDLDHVGIRSIAETLVHHHQSSLVMPDRQIGFRVQGHESRLNVTQATQLALVLNELIQNALVHGFGRATEGEIHVTVEEHEGEVSVWVSNNGDPLPPGFDPVAHGSLGLKIVDNLARGMGGHFRLENRLGWTVAEVKFPRASGE